MAQLPFMKSLSALFKLSTGTGVAETPELYLKVANKCMERAQRLTILGVSSSPKFNYGQCKYLADKLKMAVESGTSFLMLLNRGYFFSFILEDRVKYLEIFKVLYALANAVESYIRSCCADAWIRAAIMLTNVSEHISSVCFNLELCTIVFSNFGKNFGSQQLTQTDVDGVSKFELETVREKASVDVKTLLTKLKGVIQSNNYSREDRDLASFLLERFSPHASRMRFSKTVLRNLEQMERLGKDCSIVMELMDEDLFSLMQKRLRQDKTRGSPFTIMEAVDIMFQVGGMYYLHKKKIVHRDLKSLNILVRCLTVMGIDRVVAKVADFGLSKTKETSMTYSNQTPNIGTSRWMAPEMIKSENSDRLAVMSEGEASAKYPFKSDVYSFGMVCFEILTGDMPFSNVRRVGDVKMLVLAGRRPELPNQCPEKLKRLIVRCWSSDASNRPCFGEICAELRYLKCSLLMTSALGKAPTSVNNPVQPKFYSRVVEDGDGSDRFAAGVVSNRNTIGVRAFDFASTIMKGFHLNESLEAENIRSLKEVVLVSESVQRLVSTDHDKLFAIAAADKRNELALFAHEVLRLFEARQDAQLTEVGSSNLSQLNIAAFYDCMINMTRFQSKGEVDVNMEVLVILATNTADLYHGMLALDRLQTDLALKLGEYEGAAARGEIVALLKSRVKNQEKHVKALRKRSLWSRTSGEVMALLVGMGYFLCQKIIDIFGLSVYSTKPEIHGSPYWRWILTKGLGALALPYANIINQIDNLARSPDSITPDERDNLYQGLPKSIKIALSARLRNIHSGTLSNNEIKADLNRILKWLVPVASNTTKTHHVYGRVGHWAYTWTQADRKAMGHVEINPLQTLRHAKQHQVEFYIVQLLVGLSHLVYNKGG